MNDTERKKNLLGRSARLGVPTLLTVAILVLPGLVAGTPVPHTRTADDFATQHETLMLDAATMRDRALNQGRFDIRLFGVDYSFAMTPLQDLAPGAVVSILDTAGHLVGTRTPTPFIIFSGRAQDGMTVARLSLPGQWVQGQIKTPTDTIYLDSTNPQGGTGLVETIAYRHSDLKPSGPAPASATSAPARAQAGVAPAAPPSLIPSGPCQSRSVLFAVGDKTMPVVAKCLSDADVAFSSKGASTTTWVRGATPTTTCSVLTWIHAGKMDWYAAPCSPHIPLPTPPSTQDVCSKVALPAPLSWDLCGQPSRQSDKTICNPLLTCVTDAVTTVWNIACNPVNNASPAGPSSTPQSGPQAPEYQLPPCPTLDSLVGYVIGLIYGNPCAPHPCLQSCGGSDIGYVIDGVNGCVNVNAWVSWVLNEVSYVENRVCPGPINLSSPCGITLCSNAPDGSCLKGCPSGQYGYIVDGVNACYDVMGEVNYLMQWAGGLIGATCPGGLNTDPNYPCGVDYKAYILLITSLIGSGGGGSHDCPQPVVNVVVDQEFAEMYGTLNWDAHVRTLYADVNSLWSNWFCINFQLSAMTQDATYKNWQQTGSGGEFDTFTHDPKWDPSVHPGVQNMQFLSGKDYLGCDFGLSTGTYYSMVQAAGDWDCSWHFDGFGSEDWEQEYGIKHELGHNWDAWHNEADEWWDWDGFHRSIMKSEIVGYIEDYYSYGDRDTSHNNVLHIRQFRDNLP